MTPEATKYYDLCLWFVKNQDSKDYTTDQFEQVLKKIGIYEDKLRELGASEKQIQKLIDQVAGAYQEYLDEVQQSDLTKFEVERRKRLGLA